MIVGIDVHKREHVAALLDERGGELGTFHFANSPEGMRRLLGWLLDQGAGEAVVGVESPAGYGRLLVASLDAAGHEVLNVPAWRTHRERRRHGPGKTDPGDAIAVAQVVLRKRAELGPALEPQLVRALALLELQRRRLVRNRTQAIQRLRADWNQIDPAAEARVINMTRQRELRRLKRISFGDALVEKIAAACIRDLARDVDDLNQRITALDKEIAQLLEQHPPRRQPATQRRPLPHRHRPSPSSPARAHLPRPQNRGRQDATRSAPCAQAPPRERHLPPPLRVDRDHASAQHLT
jgi:transposase